MHSLREGWLPTKRCFLISIVWDGTRQDYSRVTSQTPKMTWLCKSPSSRFAKIQSTWLWTLLLSKPNKRNSSQFSSTKPIRRPELTSNWTISLLRVKMRGLPSTMLLRRLMQTRPRSNRPSAQVSFLPPTLSNCLDRRFFSLLTFLRIVTRFARPQSTLEDWTK